MYCVNCGEKNREDAKFCSRCGQKVVGEVEGVVESSETQISPSVQQNTTVEEQINKGKSNKNILLVIGALLVLVGAFVFGKPLLNQGNTASTALYTGIDSLMTASAADFDTKISDRHNSAVIKGHFELSESLFESKADFSVSSDGEKMDIKLEDGIISNNYGDEVNVDEIMYYGSNVNGLRWDYLVRDGAIDKEWVFDQVDTLTGMIPTYEIPFRIPKVETLDILLKDFFLNNAQDKNIEEKLFVRNKKEGNNHYILTINTWDFVEVFSDYLDTVEDDSKKIEKLGLKTREVSSLAEAINWLRDMAIDEGVRDDLIREDVDIEVKLNKKNQLETLSVATSKNIGVTFDIELSNLKASNNKRK